MAPRASLPQSLPRASLSQRSAPPLSDFHKIGAILCLVSIASWSMPPQVPACRGSPRPPQWGRTTVLGKAVPAVFAVAGSPVAVVVQVPVAVFIGATGPVGPPCTPTVTQVTLSMACIPPPPAPPPAVVGAQVFPTPAQGFYFPLLVPVTIPPGPPRICALTGVATTTWANGATSTGAGDIDVCIVDPAPGEPIGGRPRLDLQVLSPTTQTNHPGDEIESKYLLTNNDPTASVTLTIHAESEQAARMPQGSTEPAGSGSGVFAIAEPFRGDHFPIAFSDALLVQPPPGDNYVLDDGSPDGFFPDISGSLLYLNRFTVVAGQECIDRISVKWGAGEVDGPVRVVVYTGPDDDDLTGDLLVPRVVADGPFQLQPDGSVTYQVPPTYLGPEESEFWVGVVVQDAANTAPVAVDSNGPAGSSFFAADDACQLNAEDLLDNNTPPTPLEAAQDGAFIIRAHGSPEPLRPRCVELPMDPTEMPIPEIRRTMTLCPGESRVLRITSRSAPMCPPGSMCEQRLRLTGTYSDGTPAMACAAVTHGLDTSVPPKFECPDGGATATVAVQGEGVAFTTEMPTHSIHQGVRVPEPDGLPGGVVINNLEPEGEDPPTLVALPPVPSTLDANVGRIQVRTVAKQGGPAIQAGEMFHVRMMVSTASKVPGVDTALVAAVPHFAAAGLGDTYFFVGAFSEVSGEGIPAEFNPRFDLFFHVSVDGDSNDGQGHRLAQILQDTVLVEVVSDQDLLITFFAEFPSDPSLPDEIEGISVLVDPTGIAVGVPVPQTVANNPPTAVINVAPSTELFLQDGRATATLDGTASDDGDGGAQGLSFLWRKVSGPAGGAVESLTSPTTAVTFTQEGDYTYYLTVDDGQPSGNTHSALVRIHVSAQPPGPHFIRGDTEPNGRLNITDAVVILEHIFRGRPIPCRDAADVDDDGAIIITDAVGVLEHLFLPAPPPAAPYPECGPDPTEDALDCQASPHCEP